MPAREALLAQLGGRDDEVEAHSQQNNNESSPCEKPLRSEGVLLPTLGPDVRCVDWGVAIHVGAVLVLEAVHSVLLACRSQMTSELVYQRL